MTLRIAINGLGRIGRCVLRAWVEQNRTDVKIVAVNGPADAETHAHLLQYDSVHGVFAHEVRSEEGMLYVGPHAMHLFHERDPDNLDWGKVGADIVLECTGKFKTHEDASRHLTRGAKKVLISAPSPDPDATIVYGVNNEALKPEHRIISVGSCTTNCLAPMAKIMHEKFGIVSGFMTTIHAYTGDQNLIDGSHKDLRRGRAAALSMVPTSTGAAKALGKVLPALEGKLDGTAIRVPTPNVSMVDLCFTSGEPISRNELNHALRGAASAVMRDILGICDRPLVSCDFNHSPFSCVADVTQTQTVGDHFGRIAGWYDNEWGFSLRMLDVAALAGAM